MKILVFAHQLEIGGTQTNAIELSAALRDRHGHEVIMFATPGPAVALAQQKGLRYVPAPDALVHPSPSRMRALRDVVRRERPDLIHAWDWWQCLDAYYIEHLLTRIPVAVTDMNMSLTRLLPKGLHTTFGTPELVDQARAAGWRRAHLLLPPVDVGLNAPEALDPRPFRDQYGIRPDELVLVTVSRLDLSMKAESLRRSVAAVRTLAPTLPLRFLIVGDGRGRLELEQLAAEANAHIGRRAITLTGPLLDPRPAYAAADIVIGMGGSALRAMAFAKPVIIVGEQGFSAPFSPETAESFYYRGMYGRGDGDADRHRHAGDIQALAERRERLPALGELSRQFVVRHFSLETVSGQLAGICADAAADSPSAGEAAVDGLRTAAVWLRERRLLSYRFWERIAR